MVIEAGKSYPNVTIAAQGIDSEYRSVSTQETFQIIADIGRMRFILERDSSETSLYYPARGASKIDRFVRLLKASGVPVDGIEKMPSGILQATKIVVRSESLGSMLQRHGLLDSPSFLLYLKEKRTI